MRNLTSFLAITFFLGVTSSCYSEENSSYTVNKSETSNHRFFIGPDVFFQHSHLKFMTSFFERSEITSNTIFGGLRMGYDYVKPRSFYFGTDGLVAIGRSSIKTRFQIDKQSNSVPLCSYGFSDEFFLSHHGTPLFANIEQRYGYTFQSPVAAKFTLIPFAGIGWYFTQPEFASKNSFSHWFYSAIGMRASQQFCENFDVGFNFKAMYSFAGSEHLKEKHKTFKDKIDNTWGYEVALPFTWHLGVEKRWDLQLQPYLLKLDVDSVDQILGIRFECAYSF